MNLIRKFYRFLPHNQLFKFKGHTQQLRLPIYNCDTTSASRYPVFLLKTYQKKTPPNLSKNISSLPAGLPVFRTSGLSDFQTSGLSVFPTSGLSLLFIDESLRNRLIRINPPVPHKRPVRAVAICFLQIQFQHFDFFGIM